MSRLPARTRAAIALGRAASGASKALGRGSGEVIGGKLALMLAPDAVAALTIGRPVVCVSGTNGKTTTTRLLAQALSTLGPVTTNGGGANMTDGVLTALSHPPYTGPVALEVDEIYLPQVAIATAPTVIALLNVSRDQLDRSNETRRIAGLWRTLGESLPETSVVANADDPLVVWAALGFSRQVWVGAGQVWTADAMVCPSCSRLLRRADGDWWCTCGLRRPSPDIELPDLQTLVIAGTSYQITLALPGRCNVANAAMAAAAAGLLGVTPAAALAAMAHVGGVEGRYGELDLAPGRRGRLLLAKNPAGWLEMLELLRADPPRPCLIAFNSRTADGKDPSWLWDVPMELLAGRRVLVTGERAQDISVRLAYADVAHAVYSSVEAAALAADTAELDVIANYTAFRQLVFGESPS